MTGRCETKIPPEHSFLWLFEEALISAPGGEGEQEISQSEGSELTYLRLLSCVLNLKIVNFQLFFRRLASLRSKAWRLASVLQRAGLQYLLKARRQTKMERTGRPKSLPIENLSGVSCYRSQLRRSRPLLSCANSFTFRASFKLYNDTVWCVLLGLPFGQSAQTGGC